MDPHKNLSTYLLRPNLAGVQQRRARSLQAGVVFMNRTHPRIYQRLFGSLMIWVMLVATVRYVTAPHSLSTQPRLTSDSQSSLSLTSPAKLASTAPLTSATHADILPTGPTGQLLPPGSMAPDYTYANNYAHGQCTWYVAGRRPIPPNWGNAAQWYYHAISNGWQVGTIPAIGAVAWTPAGYYGHVALVEKVSDDGNSVYISEMNWRGLGVKSYRWTSAHSFKYIY